MLRPHFRATLKPSALGGWGSPSTGWAKNSWSYWVTSTFQLEGRRWTPVELALGSFQTKYCQGFWQHSEQGTRQGKDMA